MNIQAIQTNFDGHRFRSRLEARWAVFFKAHNIPYLYEPEGYVVDGKPYLPDFLLTDCGTWVEVKGQEAELDKDFLGTASAQLPLIQSGRKYAEEGPRLIVLGQIPDPHSEFVRSFYSPDMGRVSFDRYDKNYRPWVECDDPINGNDPLPWLQAGYGQEEPDEECSAALVRAKAARFEHGEKG